MPPMDNVKLDFLVEQSKRTLDEVRGLKQSFTDMLGRLQSLENNVVDIKRDIVRIDHRLDGFDQRLTRIERRLDLVST
jgi:DNA repair ATPase RecN